MNRRTDARLILALIILSAVLGAVLWRGRPDLTAAERERERIKNEALAEKLAIDIRQKQTLSNWIVVAKVAAGGLALVAVTGAVVVALAFGVRLALTIAPNRQGIFPLIMGRLKGSWVVYDANRSPSAVTSIGDGKPQVTYSLPEGMDQARITAQAQAVQALAAVASGEQGGSKAGELVSGVMGQSSQLGRPLPDVQKSPWEPSHIERLLIESGMLEDSYD
jgi:hypothetical protein